MLAAPEWDKQVPHGRGVWGLPVLHHATAYLFTDAARRRLWVVAAPSSLRGGYDPELRQVHEAVLPKDASLAAIAAIGIAAENGAIWTVGGDRLRKLGAEGRLLFEKDLPGILEVAGDFRGGAWAATARDLLHLGPDGQVLARLQPFAGAGTITALAVQPRDGSVWAANEVDLAKANIAGRVVRRVSPEPPVRLRALALALAAETATGEEGNSARLLTEVQKRRGHFITFQPHSTNKYLPKGRAQSSPITIKN